MRSVLITHIGNLVNARETNELLRGDKLSDLPIIKDAWIQIEDDQIAGFGEMKEFPRRKIPPDSLNANGATVLPSWCDSHTHLVFHSSREEEFVMKIKGSSYAEIAAMGGGILNSAKKIKDCTEDQLFDGAWKRMEEVSRLGTGAIEIKSGYGLSVDAELKMLRVIKKLKERSGLLIKSTFLGAHAYPLGYKEDHQEYIDLIINEMLPVIAKEKLADYIDVFCENGFFSPSEMETICQAGKSYGLRPKLHVNQLNSIGGIEAATRQDALTVDHLETMTDHDIRLLGQSNTIGTLLPAAAFFLRLPYPPARELINAGAALAIASDFNPGSAPSGNMNLVVAMSCISMKMLPEEAIQAATNNGAYAMGVEQQAGSITVGKKANLILTKPLPSLAYLAYSFGTNLIDKVMLNGEWL